jgi:hypothetical protein
LQTHRLKPGGSPIDAKWLSYQVGRALGDDCIVFDDTIVVSQVHDYLQCADRDRTSTILEAAADGRRVPRLAPNWQRRIAP